MTSSKDFNEILSLVENECKEGTYVKIANFLKNLYSKNPDDRLPNHDRLWISVKDDEDICQCHNYGCDNRFITTMNYNFSNVINMINGTNLSEITIQQYIPETINELDDSLIIDIIPYKLHKLALIKYSSQKFIDFVFSHDANTINNFCSRTCIKEFVEKKYNEEEQFLVRLPDIDQNFIEFMKSSHIKLAECLELDLLKKKKKSKKTQQVQPSQENKSQTETNCLEKNIEENIKENMNDYMDRFSYESKLKDKVNNNMRYRKNSSETKFQNYKNNADFIIYEPSEYIYDEIKQDSIVNEKDLLGKKLFINLKILILLTFHIDRSDEYETCIENTWMNQIFSIVRYFKNYISLSNIENILYSNEQDKVQALNCLRIWMQHMGFENIQPKMRGRNLRKIIREHDKNVIVI